MAPKICGDCIHYIPDGLNLWRRNVSESGSCKYLIDLGLAKAAGCSKYDICNVCPFYKEKCHERVLDR